MNYRKLAEQFMLDSFGAEPPFTPPEDMSKGEAGILTYLSFFHNNVLAGELSKQLRLTSGRIAIALKGLERKGYVKRKRDEKDHRKVIVTVTPKGKEHATKQKEHALNSVEAILKHLGEEDSKEFIRLFHKIYGISDK